tara:strand:- start:103 stop:420 length:318 start_codon:yes stop_codon:yes gene_type:complete
MSLKRSIKSNLKTVFEAAIDIGSGFFLALLVQLTLIPYLFNIQFNTQQSIGIVFTFMIVSLIRSTLWRRFFRHRYKQKAELELLKNNYCNYCKRGYKNDNRNSGL